MHVTQREHKEEEEGRPLPQRISAILVLLEDVITNDLIEGQPTARIHYTQHSDTNHIINREVT